jgi:hypothetical protein
VYVDLDRVPGPMHSKESARNIVAGLLERNMAHYNPRVSVTSDPDRPIPLGLKFDQKNRNFTSNDDWNRTFLRTQFNWFHDKLSAQGHLFLNEVLDALGMERTSLGATHGWLASGEKPNFRMTNEVPDDLSIGIFVRVHGDIHNKI